MKKLVKLALVVSMFVAMCMTSVSAATYKTKGTVVNCNLTDRADGTLAIELQPGTYVSGTYEVGAHLIKFANGSNGTEKNNTTFLTPTESDPWYLLASFTLSSAEVAKLSSTPVIKVINPSFPTGASDIVVKVGSGNYQAYTADSSATSSSSSSSTSTSTVDTSMGSGPSTTDLAYYSYFNMTVFVNSRVTSIKKSGNGFKITGYMWEDGVTPVKGLVREVVFVRTDDYDPTKAYRVATTPLTNGWLNSNSFATQNGKVDLTYANYEVTVNPYNVTNYKTKATQRMAAGTYYAYMRISNGKVSYLFQLRDNQTSNGTMESNGTLPDGFTVYDKSTRALIYTVK